MDFNKTIDLIIKDLDEAREIIDDLKSYPGIPLIEAELAKAKCKSAADVIALLKNMQNFSPYEEKKPVTKPEAETVVQKKSSEPGIVPEEKHEKPIVHKSSHVKNDVSHKPPVITAETPIIADTFGLSDRVNEKIGGLREDEGVSEIIKSKPLTNLSEAIGVNDKFLFIRELFNGDSEAYSQAVTKIESAATLSDARAVLLSYRGDNKETEAYLQFMKIVKRKFPSDE